LLLALFLGGLLASGESAAPETALTHRFHFAGLDRTYRDESPELAPVRQGPLTIRLSSPSNTVILHHHELALTPLADGTHRARLEVELSGHGTVVADVDLSGAGSRLEDELVIPRQSRVFEGRVKISRAPEGYVFTALELPETVEVAFESRLAKTVLGTCRAMALVPLISLDCAPLEKRLSTAVIALPPPGQRFLLTDAVLSDEDRGALDRYLVPGDAGAAGPSPGVTTRVSHRSMYSRSRGVSGKLSPGP
jgi:hypothetical protein